MQVKSRSEVETDRFGAILEASLPVSAVVGLRGTLGAGKTRLVQAIAAAAGIDRKDVTSPTFVLCQQYQGQRTIFHLDAYRIKDDDEFLALGVDEMFASPALVLIEWADRVERCLPPSRIDLSISLEPDNVRQFEIVDHQELPSRLIAAIEQEWKDSE